MERAPPGGPAAAPRVDPWEGTFSKIPRQEVAGDDPSTSPPPPPPKASADGLGSERRRTSPWPNLEADHDVGAPRRSLHPGREPTLDHWQGVLFLACESAEVKRRERVGVSQRRYLLLPPV